MRVGGGDIISTTRCAQARFGRLHNLGMAVVSAGMIGAAALHFTDGSAAARGLSSNDPRFVLFALLALVLGYHAWLGIRRCIDRAPQVVIDDDGILLGFGRNRRIGWDDIEWVRLRRLGLRSQLEIGVAAPAFIAAGLRLSMWNFDDGLRPVRGMPTAVLVRDNGLDIPASAMLDAVKRFRPNLART